MSIEQKNIITRLANCVLVMLLSLATFAQSQTPPVASATAMEIATIDFTKAVSAHSDFHIYGDSLDFRLRILDAMLIDSLLLLHGRRTGILGDPVIQQAGFDIWRETIMEAVARVHFRQETAITGEEIDSEYRFRNTVIATRFLPASDSLGAVDYLRRFAQGERFESIALRAFPLSSLLSSPGTIGAQYTTALDLGYARAAYDLQPGDWSQPVRSDTGFVIVTQLDTEFRPLHGHFERVKWRRGIAIEYQDEANMAAAWEILNEWAWSLPLKWKRWGPRKVLKTGLLNGADTTRVLADNPELETTEMFALDDQVYTLDWMTTRRDLRSPDTWNHVTSMDQLDSLARSLLIMDRLLEMANSLLNAGTVLREANESRSEAIRSALVDSVKAALLASVDPTHADIQRYYHDHLTRYRRSALIQVDEIVFIDSTQADSVMRILARGADFGALAQEFTERAWAREERGYLGWVPLGLYHPLEDSLNNAPRRTLLGPLNIGGYWVVLRIRDSRVEGAPPIPTIFDRLKMDWFSDNRERLLADQIQRLKSEVYAVEIDTALVADLKIFAGGSFQLPLPPPLKVTLPDSADTLDYSSQARQDSTADYRALSPTELTQPDSTDTLGYPSPAPQDSTVDYWLKPMRIDSMIVPVRSDSGVVMPADSISGY